LVDFPAMDEKDSHLEQQSFHADNPWEALRITTNSKSASKLIPIGASILRQITFRKSNNK
jgi:hypothetical protein